MRELRTDPTTGDVVVISPERTARPHHLLPGRRVERPGATCPFCPGHEASTPPTLASVERQGRWVVRAFANKYPGLGIEGPLERRAHGPYDRVSGVGAHEVVVESPQHEIAPWRSLAQMCDALSVAQVRMRDLARDSRFRQLCWFRNDGPEAGGSLGHPHAQVMALPDVPPTIRRMMRRCRRHWDSQSRWRR
jgi:UDPglucose--hexose-1-phosphate uridylyltransferase